MESINNKKSEFKRRNKRIVIVLSVIFIVLILILVVLGIKDKKKDSEGNNLVQSELYSEDTKALTIKTSYCELNYPATWEEILHTETISEEGNEVVQFWAELKGKERVHLFDVIFGDDGYEVGTLETKEGDIVTINVLSHDFTPDDTWTEEEKDSIYVMLEDINFLLMKLEEVEGFQSIE